LSTRRSLAFSFLDRYASLAIGIASSMVLARLLTPEEVGVFSVVMALLAMVATVRDLGAGQYLLQEKDLTTERIRAVWAVQLGLGAGLALLVTLCSSPVANFYAEPRMRAIILLLALNYFVNPFGSVTYAWLMREMRYESIAIIRFSATAAGAGTSMLLAYSGHGPLSLAWGSLASTSVNALVSVLFRPRGYPWLPGVREIGRVLAFGTRITSTSIINTIAVGAPEFCLGKLQSLSAAGFYSRANGLVAMLDRLVTDAVYTVALSLFSKESREARDSGASLLKSIACVAALSWSFAFTLMFLAHPLVLVLYGSQWDASAGLVPWLAGALLFAAPIPLCRAALIGAGAVRKVLHASALSGALSVALAAFGALFGLIEVGIALLVAAALSAVAWLSVTRHACGFDWRERGARAAVSLLVALASAVAPALVWLVFGTRPQHTALALLLGALGCAAGFLLALWHSDHPLGQEAKRLVPGFKSWFNAWRTP
jgi:O-antigen/teichoic acid export membrane protein